MGDKEKLENIRERIKTGKNTFKEICAELLNGDNIAQETLGNILLLAEEIAFPKGPPSFPKNALDSENKSPNGKNITENIYKKYEKLMYEMYPKFLYLMCVFLKECARYQFTTDISSGGVFFEKSVEICQEMLFILRKRTVHETSLGYIPSSILSLLLEIIRTHCKDVSPEFISAVHEIKRLEGNILEILAIKTMLGPLFKLFKCIIDHVGNQNQRVMQSLLKTIEKTEAYKTSLYFEQNKTVPFLAKTLREELRTWGMNLIHPVYFYIDPAYPLLAAAIVIKPDNLIYEPHEGISMYISLIMRELMRYTPYVDMRVNYLYIDVGDTGTDIDVNKWNYLGHIYNLDVIRCEINFTTQNVYEASRFIDGLVRSVVAQDIISLSMYPSIPLSRKVQCVLIDNLRIESLDVKECLGSGGISSCVEEFICLLAKRKNGTLRYLRELAITSPFYKAMATNLQKITFYGIQKLTLEFIALDRYYNTGSIKNITELVNTLTFPVLHELNIKNHNITKEDFNFLNLNMNLVQIQYGKFYCPSGSSYRPEQHSYTFKRPESVAMSSGIVFIIAENIVYEWTVNYVDTAFSDCLVCKIPFCNNSNKQVVILSCGSVVHISCIVDAFGKKKNPCCPFCKKKVQLIMGSPMAVDIMFKPPMSYTRHSVTR
ncbi:hypothetical protein NEPAR06_1928 [Nematocida parisii]|uniref:RING-type domain-containing protein n=1 Tax=Nematocida parisii (strain ERTm3) TaxID=935791 RepID=I3EF29_NEMP3|nr:uncharacterized protein NEPG_02003 [Nematocida parisii ERTm1]EIJ87826.1 hypothetical protein NEQG_01898 [Nematocida parisii ERTm3]KAI5129265.1 hypothetical protein NEPAR03_1626 [Nematocida parisii]EIJ93047.1 hypothetical protein NEPG_02003 [Nematocida parisii ERTm1]KAI5129443.1 hypothetical protein NEPAR08_1593 [Nematocida parisii]KAI5141998.1 hypothetical protein NEPAR04_1354 [Nematocida parisii]|eukprot:XP_013059830.1 hypothetical protein NEPG_02003 [Nematocida parisii ERTm1]